MTDIFFVKPGQLRTILEINADLVWFVRISGICVTFALQIQSHDSNQNFQYSSQCHESKGSRASQHFDHAEKRRLIAEVFICFANVCGMVAAISCYASLNFPARLEPKSSTPHLEWTAVSKRPNRSRLLNRLERIFEMTDLTISCCFKCFKNVWRVVQRLCGVMFFIVFPSFLQLSHATLYQTSADLNCTPELAWSSWRTVLKLNVYVWVTHIL